MITVIAHFNKGKATQFPKSLNGIAAEGSVFLHPNLEEGGIILVSYNTYDADLLIKSFKEHLKDNDLSLLALQKKGEQKLFFSWTDTSIF